MCLEPSFGRVVRDRRRALDLTQEELSRRVGCAAITVRKIEANDLRPSVQIAERLAMALAIPVEERAEFVRQARAIRLEPVPAPALAQALEPIGREDLTGRAIRGYALAERIGVGGMGAVYRAIQPNVEREVALKVILPAFANHTDFVRRFEAEAQLVARLEHPRIVPLYDYWREPGVAYLVMRLMRGGSVQTLLDQGPVPLDSTVRFLEQICEALHAAHCLGMVHRDLKPANVLLDEEANAYLSDFGIAATLGHSIVNDPAQVNDFLSSTPDASPRQIHAIPAQPQTDIYSLGVMLYEMLTGSSPFTGPMTPDRIQPDRPPPLPPLAAQRAGLPATLDEVIRRALGNEPGAQYADVLQFLADFHSAVRDRSSDLRRRSQARSAASRLPIIENPYKGLHAFAEADAEDFYGRDTLIQQLLARLGEGGDLSRFLAIIGPSGSGKSSVAKAGLIPALRRGGLPGSENWLIVDLMPGTHPFQELEAALLRVAVYPPGNTLQQQLKESDRGLLQAARRLLPAAEGLGSAPEQLVLVIDQFEEVFTLVQDEAERIAFLRCLVSGVLDEESCLRVVVTVRADFIDQPLRYIDFGELLRRRSEFVLPLTPDEMERAINAPAGRVGLTLEPGLADAIIREVADQPGALPLLQYALTELFEAQEDGSLTRRAYHALGGVRGALGRRAEEVFAGLSAEGQAAARQVFLRLVTPGEGAEDTRRRLLRAELEGLEGARAVAEAVDVRLPEKTITGHRRPLPVAVVLESFGRARLLTFDRDPLTRGPTVEVAHEALLREWSRLAGWRASHRADMRLQRQLAQAAAEWQGAPQDPSYLLSGGRLAQFETWAVTAAVHLTAGERAFLELSCAERDRHLEAERRRQQQETDTLRQLALTERARAEQQAHAAGLLRRRALYLMVTLVLALTTALAAAFFANRSATLAVQNAANAATAQAANTQAVAQRLAAESNLFRADAERLAAEANGLLHSNGSPELIALLAIRAMRQQYSPQGDAALAGAASLNYPVQLFRGHTKIVWGAAFSPDGQRVLTGSEDGTARLWDVQTGREIRQFACPNLVYLVAFAPDGRTFLTNCGDTSIRLWDPQTGRQLRQFKPTDFADQPLFSPDGKQVLAASRDGVVWVWDTATGRLARQFEVPISARARLFVSPDAQYVLSQSFTDQTARLWRLGETVREVQAFNYFDTLFSFSVAFSPDDAYVLIGYSGGSVLVWDTRSGQAVQRLEGHTGAVTGIAFSPDANQVLTGSADKTVRLWDWKTGAELVRLSHPEQVFASAFSGDGQYVLAGSSEGSVRLWEIRARPEFPVLSGHTAIVPAVAFSPDGKYLATGGSDGLQLWETDTGRSVRVFKEAGFINYGVRFSPDGRTLLSGNWAGVATLWDVNTGQAQRQFVLPTSTSAQINDVAFSPDGRQIFIGGADDSVFPAAQVWDVETEKSTLSSFITYRLGDAVNRVAFSPDGRYLLTAHQGTLARLWDAQSGQPIREFVGHTDVVNGAAFSPDGKAIATASNDRTLRLWDVGTGQEIRRFIGHTETVWSVAFSPDGQTLASASADGTARLWDVQTGQELRRFVGHTAGVQNVAFAPDGRHIATVGDDGTARLWDVDYHATIDYLCSRLVRDFTQAEQAEYSLPDRQPTCP